MTFIISIGKGQGYLHQKISPMKPFWIILFCTSLIFPLSKQDELQAVEATYEGQSGDVFYFVDIEGSSYAFEGMDAGAQNKYDLCNARYVGKKFMVVYRIEYATSEDKEDEDDYDDFGQCVIVDLEPIG